MAGVHAIGSVPMTGRSLAQPLCMAPHRDLRKPAMSTQPVEIGPDMPGIGIADRRGRQHALRHEKADETDRHERDNRPTVGPPPAHTAALAVMPRQVLPEPICGTLECLPRQMRPGAKMTPLPATRRFVVSAL